MKKIVYSCFAVALVFLSMNCFSTNGQASEIEKYDNSDILNIIQTKNDTQIFMPDNTIIVLKDFTEKISKEDIQLTVEAEPILARAAFGFPDKIHATASVAKRNGPSSIYVERSKSKAWISGGYKVAHYRGNIPKKRTQMVGNKWYSIYEGNIGIHYIGSK
ncbi:hypothetical protein [Enterococcus faecalis]|uniref:Uncharacterized protein n=2 Tax=Enterococcus faecalis TaxID=1351 RepID=A0A7G8A8T2_ENTFL|nr:hypothetical protein [Enterococcus faecalis]KXF69141.1 hypothetical protein AQ486_15430 [Enterococcus faecalis]KXF73729.1 hypothetical protein AQ487_05285 [Enterococcus faecalis]MBC2812269.1 hypothetical protein [Enterococcus faecalis]MBC2818448.1 hypothetical protein [Enterococcus faecalis]MBC2820302.1 hypothetical protein [Enterococcus faecalis]